MEHGVNFTRNFTETYTEIVESLQNKTLIVTTIRVGTAALVKIGIHWGWNETVFEWNFRQN
jgi:hypothetical protein